MTETLKNNAGQDNPRIRPSDDGWQRTLWAMVGIQFVMTAAINFLSPIIPLMLPQLGVETVEGVDIWSGIITGSTSFVAAFASPIWGRVADRHGRKLSLLRSSFAIALFTAVMGLATNVWWFFGARAVMGAFAGFSSAAIALVASQAPERRLGYALGWLSSGQLIGSLVGPVIGGVLADLTGSYRAPFFWCAAITCAGLALVWAVVTENFTPVKPTGQRRSLFSGLGLLTGSAGLSALFLVLLMAQFSTRTVQPVVTIFVQELIGSPPQIATLAGIAFSITGLANLIAAPFLGNRSDIIGYRKVLLICLLGATLTSAPQIFVNDYWSFVAERFAVGLFIGGILPTANALIGRSVSREHRGTIYGMTASATFLGNSLGPLTGGGVAASFGIRWVFVVTTVLLAANLVWVWFTVPELQEPTVTE
ncbi:MAG: transporter, family, multidrug resistance protein [Acetobacteraceae bacterium]|jgi:DHA1 family multidrug resistance protein-like MFS transporter|nr:transporter, family, multidrug resistance protein [Acetobacteraceae bacterium]